MIERAKELLIKSTIEFVYYLQTGHSISSNCRPKIMLNDYFYIIAKKQIKHHITKIKLSMTQRFVGAARFLAFL